MTITTRDEMLDSLFHSIGFSDKEAAIYRVLLEKGQATAGEIIKASGLKRGITYAILYSFEEKGLIRIIKNQKKILFALESPQKLLDLVSMRKQEVDSAENSLKYYMPKLMSEYKLSIGKPTVRYYEGMDGIKEVFEDIYAPKKKPVYGCVDLEIMHTVFPAHALKKLIPKRVHNKLVAYTFFGDSEEARALAEKDKEHLRQTICVNKKEYPMPAEIDVYDDKVAMLSFAKNDFVGLIVENPEFAESLRSIFKLAFEKKTNK
jgi:sugar-specific transcriptional regulator TrmB